MGTLTRIAAVLLAGAALCLVSLSGVAYSAPPQFIVEGEVYCEVCRTNFINRLSEPMSGATVKLECRGEDPTSVTYSLEGETDYTGHYRMVVEGDHGTEECAVTLMKSSRDDCAEIPNEGWAIEPTARITITKNSGFHDNVRHANPLGFTKKKADPACVDLFKELDLDPTNNEF